MPRAEILLEDNGEHADVRFLYPEGFNKDSPSHKMSLILRKLLDQHFQAITPREDHGDLTQMDLELAKIGDLPAIATA